LFLRSPPLPPRHPTPTLFPYTTLFRSIGGTPGTRPPPLRGRASERAADAVVREPEPAKLRRVVEIPCVHDQRLLQETYDFCEIRSEEHTSELQSRSDLVCRLLLEKKKT